MPKTRPRRNKNPHVRISKPYAELRRRVRDEYGLPTMTAADSFIAQYYLDYEQQRGSLSKLMVSKPDSEQIFKDVKRFLGGFQ